MNDKAPGMSGGISGRRGFTLLEIAIVLGITGGIIAAIFAVASFASSRVTLNQGSDEVNLIAQNMRAAYSGRNPSYTSLNAVRTLSLIPSPADYCYYSPIAMQQGVFPSEMVTPQPAIGALPAAGAVANNPWYIAPAAPACGAGSAMVALAQVGAAPTQSVAVVVAFVGIPQKTCPELLVRTSVPNGATGLAAILVNSTVAGSITANSLPISSIDAATACSGATNAIAWYYLLTGG